MIDHEAILARKLRALFPDAAARAKVREELGRYGQASYEREVPRVHLAILKLAGNSLERIREWMPIAKQDYRDVLASAEYPAELITPTWTLPAVERAAIEARDAEQYQRWLEET